MPANPKYLSPNHQKFAKLTCGVIGGYLVSFILHLLIGSLVPHTRNYLVTSIVTVYLLWGFLLILPYLFTNGWKIWLIYLAIISMGALINYFII